MMECNYSAFDVSASNDRLREILDVSDAVYEEIDEVPARTRLTYKNGFYVDCIAMFVDIRGSSKLPEYHRRPALAKLYRAFTSEMTAVMAGNPHIAEINIIGDCVAGIFNGHTKQQVLSVFNTAGRICTSNDILNYQLRKRNMKELKIGVGISDGRALMIQGGKKGSGVNEALWMGEVVNLASNLCHQANKDAFVSSQVMVSSNIYANLPQREQGFLKPVGNRAYSCCIYDGDMKKWYDDNCK